MNGVKSRFWSPLCTSGGPAAVKSQSSMSSSFARTFTYVKIKRCDCNFHTAYLPRQHPCIGKMPKSSPKATPEEHLSHSRCRCCGGQERPTLDTVCVRGRFSMLGTPAACHCSKPKPLNSWLLTFWLFDEKKQINIWTARVLKKCNACRLPTKRRSQSTVTLRCMCAECTPSAQGAGLCRGKLTPRQFWQNKNPSSLAVSA